MKLVEKINNGRRTVKTVAGLFTSHAVVRTTGCSKTPSDSLILQMPFDRHHDFL
jgi:hypothetical protein